MVTVLSLAIAVLSLTGAVLASVALDSSEVQARLGAEKLANQILVGGLETIITDQMGRSPATLKLEDRWELLGSSGRLSRDPWGLPYSYRIGLDKKGRRMAVVWSSGPNQKEDGADISIDELGYFGRVTFKEDDVGVVLVKE